MLEKKKVLVINSCVNREKSRTQKLGYALCERIKQENNCEFEEIVLEYLNLAPLNSAMLNERVESITDDNIIIEDKKLANQLTEADIIVVLAPYWDLSFPSMLKVYIEHISIVGITFYYNEYGRPAGLCKADKLYYVTTAGGIIPKFDFGFEYVKAYFAMAGVTDAKSFSAQGLDIVNNNARHILDTAIEKLQYNVL